MLFSESGAEKSKMCLPLKFEPNEVRLQKHGTIVTVTKEV